MSKRLFHFTGGNSQILIGISVLAVLVIIAAFAPLISPFNPEALVGKSLQPPSWTHLFGTDQLGRDVLSQVVSGAGVTLLLAFGATLVSMAIGVILGGIAGYYGGVTDDLLSRFFEVVLTIPRLFLVILLVAFYGGSVWMTILVIGITIWPVNARLMRAQVLSVKSRVFVQAARVAGLSGRQILVRHVLPNGIAPVIANASLQMAQAVLLEVGLSFLGLGDPTVITWGTILRSGQSYMRSAWWLILLPGLALVLLLLSLHLLGDGLSLALRGGDQ